MSRIPPEIDALMWHLAEEGGPTAQAEFETRHVRYGPELTRRIRMVAELREAGKKPSPRPVFTPRPSPPATAPRWAIGAALGLATLAVGAVAFVVASPAEHPAPVTPVPAPSRRENSFVETVPHAKNPPVERPPVVREAPPVKTPSYLVPRDVRVQDTALTAAIRLVAAEGGLKVTIAPGFQDEKVSFDYRGLTPIDALRAMGEEHGFTVFEESDGEVVVIPARETGSTDRRVGP